MSGRSEILSWHISEKCIVLIVQQHTAGIEDKGKMWIMATESLHPPMSTEKTVRTIKFPPIQPSGPLLTLLHSKHPITPPLRSPHSKADTFPYSQLVMIAHLTRLMAVLSILLGEPVVNAWVFMPVVVVLSGLQ